MKILKEEYSELGPNPARVMDPAILAQAWKITDAYVRKHNWYADILELEHTSLTLPEQLAEWAESLNSGTYKRPDGLRKVIAPKNGHWHFPDQKNGGGWRSGKALADDPEAAPDVRPLAHVSIRDQVLSTAIMICLADAVETLQGATNPSQYENSFEARKNVRSYGNRLYCDWRDAGDHNIRARFRWGGSTSFSQFFTDYERFLQRPTDVCRDVLPSLQHRKLFIVKLDISKFYDCVDTKALISKLKQISTQYQSKFDSLPIQQEKHFWKIARKVMSWRWSETEAEKKQAQPLGLPQGLVASGFFANAYLHDFDMQVADFESKGKSVYIAPNITATIQDYCRYVDDIRLVVALNENDAKTLALEELEKSLSKWINALLAAYCDGLEKKLTVNPKKSEAVAWEDFAVQGATSNFMRNVQAQISLAPDPTTLLQATSNLDHLLWLADSLEHADSVDSNSLSLARISLPRIDVRDDTIKRFAAVRLRKVLRMRRSMADPARRTSDSVATSHVTELQALDHEIETVSRKLIACWSRNPALVGVLRCGLDLHPTPELIRPVLEALEQKLSLTAPRSERLQNERLISQYVLADLYRAAAVETGMSRQEGYPATSDVPGYRAVLAEFAFSLLRKAETLPWYLLQQIALFMAVMKYPVDLPDDPELERYRALHSSLRYQQPKDGKSSWLTSALIVLRTTGDLEKFIVWLRNWLTAIAPEDAVRVIDRIAFVDYPLLKKILEASRNSLSEKWAKRIAHYVPVECLVDTKSRLSEWKGKKRTLAMLIAHPENPFVQENATLKFAAAMLRNYSKELESNEVSIRDISVSCDKWDRVQDPSVKVNVEIEWSRNKPIVGFDETPIWCNVNMRWAYRLGRLLRSAIVGEADFTSRHSHLNRDAADRYRGLQSTGYKRLIGLAPLTAGLGQEPAPISPWLNEMVMRLLQWPGLRIAGSDVCGFGEVRTPHDLLVLIEKRILEQSKTFGRATKVPSYILPVEGQRDLDLSHFKVATVQTLMPLDRDFSAADPLAWTGAYRARHRAHLASMCKLLLQTLAATALAQESRGGDKEERALDLIVFPELAVHPDDMWLLDRLSDATGAVIFAGQTFVEHPYLKKPINRAVWLLRQENAGGRQIVRAYQGKANGIPWEKKVGVVGHRPYQVIVQFSDDKGRSASITGAICYDATDLELAADLRHVSDAFVVAALNKDINTFDIMASALQFHMYQPVVLANTGQYGGSTAQAPYRERHHRLIAHVHGNSQATISLFEIDLLAFRSGENPKMPKEKKEPPAGFVGRR